ncbi:MAG: EamA family transporter [Alphaproteobacteria bacterium]|nr:EamA family transporter [Alphaproteobacteria bacterium]
MTIPNWALLTIIASMCWGFGYALLGKMLHSGISSAFILASLAFTMVFTYTAMMIKGDTFLTSFSMLNQNKFLILCLLVTVAAFITGQCLIYKAISLKDAPHVAILEISYPVFTCIFTWLLFRNLELSWHVIVGGVLIFAGASLVLFKTSH